MTEVAAGLIEKDGQLLLAERPLGKCLAGYWEFPGGKLEPGESAEQAIKRELQEELQLKVEVVRSLGCFPYRYEWGEIALHAFVVRPCGEPRPTTDVEIFMWCRPDEISLSTLAPADVEPLRAYLETFAGPQSR